MNQSFAAFPKNVFWRFYGQYLAVLAAVVAVTLIGFCFTPFIGAHATALMYLLVVVALALFVSRGPALMAAALSALCWDFFFLPPLKALRIHSVEDVMMFAMYFIVALALSQLTTRIRAQQAADHQRQTRMRVLLESERLSKTLLDSMSHELRTPIAAIQSATGNLTELGHAGLTPFQRQMIEEISEANDRLHRLVGNALEMNRLEAGAVKPNLIDCDPAELVHWCVNETHKKLAGHRVRVHVPPDLPPAPMDSALMQQALANLLANAAAHTPPGTVVRVSAAVEDGFLLLTVADNGPGVPPELLAGIFDKFFRAPYAPAGGAGLGLSLVKGFVEAQGGTVLARNESKGGLAVEIRLPLCAPLENVERSRKETVGAGC